MLDPPPLNHDPSLPMYNRPNNEHRPAVVLTPHQHHLQAMLHHASGRCADAADAAAVLDLQQQMQHVAAGVVPLQQHHNSSSLEAVTSSSSVLHSSLRGQQAPADSSQPFLPPQPLDNAVGTVAVQHLHYQQLNEAAVQLALFQKQQQEQQQLHSPGMTHHTTQHPLQQQQQHYLLQPLQQYQSLQQKQSSSSPPPPGHQHQFTSPQSLRSFSSIASSTNKKQLPHTEGEALARRRPELYSEDSEPSQLTAPVATATTMPAENNRSSGAAGNCDTTTAVTTITTTTTTTATIATIAAASATSVPAMTADASTAANTDTNSLNISFGADDRKDGTSDTDVSC